MGYMGSGQGYKSESLGLEQGIIFQETDQLVEYLASRLGKLGIATQKYKKNQVGFVLAGLCQ